MIFKQEWTLRRIGTEDFFPARVPGNIQYDYAVSHGFGDINYGMNHERFLEIEDWEWEYRADVNVKPETGERVFFVSKGIDYFSDIAVNGKILFSHTGMFENIEADLTDALTGEGDVLSVFVYRHPKRAGMPADRNEASDSCKPAVSYSWDYHPRVIPSGMWDEAYLETRGPGYLRRAEMFYTLAEDYSSADVRFEADCAAPVTVTLTAPDGSVVYSGPEKAFTVNAPKLWWCSGQGDPDLYTWTVRGPENEIGGQAGFRTVRLVMNEGEWAEPSRFPKSRSTAPATFELNGRRIFAKGSNWVLPEMFPGCLTPETIEKHVRLAYEAHMNIFRLHGGSGINKDIFYTLCDRLGIMVWQEFPLACNAYPDSPAYLKTLEQEAKAYLYKLRGHVSVSLLCGGNELFNDWSRMTDQSLPLRLLNKICYEMAPERPFIATSPLFGMGHGGYTFYDDKNGCDVFALFQRSRCNAYCEFGVPATNSADYLRSIIPEDELFPPRRGGSWEAHHAFRAWGEERWLCMDVLERYWEIGSVEDIAAASGWLQCEGYKAVFEEARRQWPHCSAAINWCFSEPWKTAANNSLISYPCDPKPGYGAVREALRSTMFSARIPKFDWKPGESFRAEVWMLNDAPVSARGHVRASLELNGKELACTVWDASAEAGRNAQGPVLECVLPEEDCGKLYLRLRASDADADSTYVLQYRAGDRRGPREE